MTLTSFDSYHSVIGNLTLEKSALAGQRILSTEDPIDHIKPSNGPTQAIFRNIANIAHDAGGVLNHALCLIETQVEILSDIGLFLMKFIENIKRCQQSTQYPQHQGQRAE